MTLEELAGGLPQDCSCAVAPFATAGELRLFWVFQHSELGRDLRRGVILARNDRAIFIPHDEFPVLSDLLSGIVRRGKLS